MTPSLRILMAAASLSLLPLSANAADYDPPIVIDDVQEVVPVEVGSGWYLRGDIGYTFSPRTENRSFDVPGVALDEDNTAFFGGGGFGYHFNDYFRADLTGGYLRRERLSGTITDPSYGVVGSGSLETTMGYAMLTGYVDLGTYVGITPYVGAGIGAIYSRPKISGNFLYADGSSFNGSYSEHDFSLAYSLNAGLAYRVTDNLSIDVGYQYLNSPDSEYFSIDKPNLYGKGFDMHQVKVGLRYDLW